MAKKLMLVLEGESQGCMCVFFFISKYSYLGEIYVVLDIKKILVPWYEPSVLTMEIKICSGEDVILLAMKPLGHVGARP